jgi:hypothetical protein
MSWLKPPIGVDPKGEVTQAGPISTYKVQKCIRYVVSVRIGLVQ